MKKILLFAAAAVIAVTATAQFAKKATAVKAGQQKALPAATQKKFEVAGQKNFRELNRETVNMNKRLTIGNASFNGIAAPVMQMPVSGKITLAPAKAEIIKKIAAKAPAALSEKYNATAAVYNGSDQKWYWNNYTMETISFGEGMDYMLDIIPDNVSGWGVPVLYTSEDKEDGTAAITIAPQWVGSSENYDFFICDYTDLKKDGNGSIKMTLAADGNLTLDNPGNVVGYYLTPVNTEVDPTTGEEPPFVPGDIVGAAEQCTMVSYALPAPDTFVAETVYTGKGYDKGEAANVTWQMQMGKKDDVNVIRDLVPSISEDTGIPTDVEYTVAGDKIIIRPQSVGMYRSTYYLYLFDWDSEDGTITLTKDAQGHITTPENLNLVIGAFTTDAYTSDYSSDNYAGYFTRTEGVVYYAEDQEIPNGAPNVEYQPNNLTLFAGLGVSGYSYNSNLVMIGAYGPLNFRNSTVDDATAWNWSVIETIGKQENEITATTKDFTLNTTGGAVYTNFALVGINEEEKSDSVKWGVGKALATDGSIRYTDLYAYAGTFGSSFTFSDGTTATMTTQDPDGKLTFYTNWATPEKASNSMSKIYVYQGKPSTPIYFEGVTLPVVNFADNGDFNLHVAIRKCERDPKSGKIAMGDIVAEADATIENVDDTHAATSGLTAINFTNFYVEDEWGMSEEVEYLFMDEEFLIEIDNWDNGTFTAVLGSQDITPANALNTTFFEMTGEEGSVYSYTSWKTSLFVGLIEPAYGYLYTTDNTDLNLSVDGEAATIHVTPMLNSIDENENPTYRLFIKDITVDGEEAAEVPEWLTFSVANEDYDEEGEHYAEYDLNVTAEALPVGVQGRKAEVTFFQEGAMLKVSVQQGEVIDGISQTTVTGKVNNDGKLYDLSGRQVQAGKKGLVLMNGKKFIVK